MSSSHNFNDYLQSAQWTKYFMPLFSLLCDKFSWKAGEIYLTDFSTPFYNLEQCLAITVLHSIVKYNYLDNKGSYSLANNPLLNMEDISTVYKNCKKKKNLI